MKITLQKTFIILFLITLISCSSEQQLTKDQLLYQSITELENRFEERKLGRIVEYVSENYSDQSGRKIRDIKRAIQMQLMRHKSLHVFSVIKDIEWTGDELAKVEIAAAMGGAPMEDASILPKVRADMIKFTVEFVLEGEVYKVKSAICVTTNAIMSHSTG